MVTLMDCHTELYKRRACKLWDIYKHNCENKSPFLEIYAAAFKRLEFESKSNWMDIWSLQQIREWQAADIEINNILYFKSVNQQPQVPPKLFEENFEAT